MVGSPQGNNGLQSLSIRRLRELARSLRVHLFARLSRPELIGAISRRGATAAPIPPGPMPPQPMPVVVTPIAGPAAAEPAPGEGSWLALEPLDAPWVQLRWSLGTAARQLAEANGTRLTLRLADVTDRQGDGAPSQTQLEVQPQAGVSQWQLPLPLTGRLYRAELGLRGLADGPWISLAVSAPLWLAEPDEPALVAAAQPPAAVGQLETPGGWTPPPLAVLHERLYQAAMAPRRRRAGASEELQEHHHDRAALAGAGGPGFSASAAGPDLPGPWASGLWASGLSASGEGAAAPRQRRFWLVADAELIVYGATEPSASLRIGEESVPLTADGQFSRQVPFRDGDQQWPIEAVAADGEQRRGITLSFQRRTPEARVNTAEEAVAEWF